MAKDSGLWTRSCRFESGRDYKTLASIDSVTEKIYLKDAYAKELDAKVVGKMPNGIVLDRTIFYPTGGGVPCDTGKILIKGAEYEVAETKKEGDDVLHIISGPIDEVQMGDEVHCKIDWERRYAHMRYHTALHVVGGIMENKYNAMFTGGQIYGDRTRFDSDLPPLDRELALKIMQESQEIIDKNLNINVKFLEKEEAFAIPNLARTEPGRELLKRLTEFRVVEIEGFDLQLDGGPHVANTKEIGTLSLSNFENKGSHRKRIEFTLKIPV